MDTSNLVKLLLSDKIKNTLNEHFEITNEKEIEKIINEKISGERINDILNFDKDIDKENQCCARVWRKSIKIDNITYNFKKVDSRCSFIGSVEIAGHHYCKKHGKQLQKCGYLRLLRHDEECPKKDIIGYIDNEYVYGKDRVWYDNFNRQLEILLRHHNNRLERIAWTKN